MERRFHCYSESVLCLLNPNSSDFRKRDLLSKVGEPWRSVAVDSTSASALVSELCGRSAPAAQEGIGRVREAQLLFLEKMTKEN